jgi:hypothetical protein
MMSMMDMHAPTHAHTCTKWSVTDVSAKVEPPRNAPWGTLFNLSVVLVTRFVGVVLFF